MKLLYPQDESRDVMVLIIEDEKVSGKALAKLLALKGYVTQAVESAEEAFLFLNHGQTPNIALVDLDLPGMSGAEFIRRVKVSNPTIATVLITAADSERIEKVTRGRNTPHMRKPIDFPRLLDLLGQLSDAQTPN